MNGTPTSGEFGEFFTSTAHSPQPVLSIAARIRAAIASLSSRFRRRGMNSMTVGSSFSRANSLRSESRHGLRSNRFVSSRCILLLKAFGGPVLSGTYEGVDRRLPRGYFGLDPSDLDCQPPGMHPARVFDRKVFSRPNRRRGYLPREATCRLPQRTVTEATTMSSDTGLYRDAYERDSCGFGLIASLDDQPSHWLVQTAITSLNRLTHRGAIAGDGKTGDGCGLLLKKPEGFLRAVAGEAGIELADRFASGL